MRIAGSILLALCVLASGACAPSRDATSLAGTYAFSFGFDTLYLEPSGRFRRVFRSAAAAGGFSVDTGRWVVSRNRRLVGLSALPQRWPAHGRFDSLSGRWHEPDTLLRGAVSLQIRATWTGALTLDYKPEIDWRYRRVPSARSAVAPIE